MIGYQIVDGPSMFPGTNVDRSSDGPTVDTHIEFLDGRVYLNERVIYQALMTGILTRTDYLEGLAECYGMLTAGQAHELRLELQLAQQALAVAEGQVAELRPVADAVASAAARAVEVPEAPAGTPQPRARAPRKAAA